MIRFIILFVVAFLVYRALKNWMFPKTPGDESIERKSTGEIDDVMIKDPYCGTYFPSRDAVRYTLDGKDLAFCSETCRKQYITEHSQTKNQ